MRHGNARGLPFRRIPWYKLAAGVWRGCSNGREEIEEPPIFLLPSNGDDSAFPDWSGGKAQETFLHVSGIQRLTIFDHCLFRRASTFGEEKFSSEKSGKFELSILDFKKNLPSIITRKQIEVQPKSI